MEAPYGNYNGPPWVGVLIFGIVMLLGGTMAFVFAATMAGDPNDMFYDFNKDASRIPMAMGAVFLIFGLVIIGISLWMRTNKVGERMPELSNQSSAQNVERRVVEEVIKVRCRYCGTLNSVDDKACISCGGTL